MNKNRPQDRRSRLVCSLRDKEYRDAFFSEHISTGVSFEIRANRKARNLTQRQLGRLAGGMRQSTISRLEGPDHEDFPNLETLTRLASAFDCALIVRFAPFSELVDWAQEIADRSLVVPSFSSEFGEPTPTPRGEGK